MGPQAGRATTVDVTLWLLALTVLPWVVVSLMILLGIREPPPLPPADDPGQPRSEHRPSVRIVIPARNEARNIRNCLDSLRTQDYPDFSIVVVDDRSEDETAQLARTVESGNAKRIEVLDGGPLPAGWFGKPWACAQGARGATEDLLLFVDADTRHGATLLSSAVAGLCEDEAAALSLFGHQELRSFGERLVQPHIFTILGLRFRYPGKPLDSDRETDAIANGQFLLVRLTVYESFRGHEAVRGEVVEDLRLAQLLVREGHRLSLRSEKTRLSTRMYQSLGDVVRGWTKNIAIGARQSGGVWGRWAITAMLSYVSLVWLAPPALLVTAGVGGVPEALAPWALAWSSTVTLLGIATWMGVYHRFEVSPVYGFLYPLAAGLVGAVVCRSACRGHRRVEWKGRRYSHSQELDASG